MGKSFNPFGGKGGAGPQISQERTDFRQSVLDRTKTSRENTLRLMGELEAQSKGEGPSFGTQELAKANQRSLAQTLAAASTQRGAGAGVAATKRQLATQQGAAQRNTAEQGSIIRSQEQIAAQDALSQLANNQQAQDLQQVMQPGAVVASAESKRFEEAVKKAAEDAKRHGREGTAILGAVGTVVGGVVGSIVPGAGTAAGAAAGGAIGGVVGGAAGEASSDKRLKKDVKAADSDVKSFLDALAAKKYAYKDDTQPGTAPGKRFGIMAQDLEKSEMGKSLVNDGPQGKMVDTVQGFGALLAAQAEMHKRLKKLEKGKK